MAERRGDAVKCSGGVPHSFHTHRRRRFGALLKALVLDRISAISADHSKKSLAKSYDSVAPATRISLIGTLI